MPAIRVDAIDAAWLADWRPMPDVELEWWRLSCTLGDRWTLFACVWRFRGLAGDGGLTAAYALTPRNGGASRRSATWVDSPLLMSTRDELQRQLRLQPDPLLESILEIVRPGTIFAPFRLTDLAGTFECSDPSRLTLAVGGCRLERVGSRLVVRIEDADRTIDLALHVSDRTLSIHVPVGALSVAGRRFEAWSQAGCAVTGTLTRGGGREEIEGVGWLEHAGGEWYGPAIGDRRSHPRWRRFWLTLDTGHALMLWGPLSTAPSDGASTEACDGYLRSPDDSGREIRGSIRSPGFVVSPRTNNRYEHGWEIAAPSLGLTLQVKPFHTNNEVPVFMLARGVVEAGCQIAGELDGAPCCGTGFVEVFGEAPNINEFFWGQRKTVVAHQLERFMPRVSDGPWLQRVTGAGRPLDVDPRAVASAIVDPIWSMMDRGGKGWRSVWLMTCCHALGFDEDEQIRELLPIIELLHTGSLVIDDIQDGAGTRRGRPALHHEIGTDLAINVGCFMYFLPLLIVQEATWLTEVQRLQIYEIVLRALRQGHIGQAMDLMFAKGHADLAERFADIATTRRQLVEQYRLKSGGQLEAIAHIAGVLSGAPCTLVEAVADYSQTFGVAFQIVDDVIDLCDSPETLGKDAGEDVRNGKIDYVLLETYASAGRVERERLLAALAGDGGSVPLVRDIVRRTGAVTRCLDDAQEMIETKWRRLTPLPPSDAKIVMRSVPRWLLAQRRRIASLDR